MARRKRVGKRSARPGVVHPEAAGVDVGATAVYAAVSPDRDAQPIRRSIRVDDPHPPGELPLVEVDGEGDVVARVGEGEPSVKE